jgi:hypothetical protein
MPYKFIASPEVKEWYCYGVAARATNDPYVSSHCFRTAEMCKQNRRRTKKDRSLKLARCERADKAYCLLVSHPLREELSYACSRTLEHCWAKYEVAASADNPYKTIRDCKARE